MMRRIFVAGSPANAARLLVASAAIALPIAALGASAADKVQETSMEQAKRRAPKVNAVNVGGIKYEVAGGLRARTTGQASGVLAATDIASGKEIWTRAVYKVTYEGGEESDAQDVFIVSLKLNKAKDKLLVEDEKGRRYEVRLSDGEASPVSP